MIALPVFDFGLDQRGNVVARSPDLATTGVPSQAKPRAALPRVEKTTRKGTLLHTSPLAEGPDVLSLNVTMGCGHRCGFCSARAYAGYTGDEVVYLFANTAKRLEDELRSRRHKPRAVYLCPSTDPFPPLAEVQAEAARVIEVLACHEVDAWVMTRGYIRPSALRVLAARRERVRVTMGLTTLNRELQRVLEPLAAPPRLRLRQIVALRKLGVAVHVALEPLVPGLTDTRDNLVEVLDALKAIGVRHVTAGYMFLRQRIRDNLVRDLAPHGWDRPVLDAFAGGPVLEAGSIAAARYLPRAKRQRQYASLMALAAERGISVRLCGVTNPDFQPPRRLESDTGLRQMLLPMH